MGKEANGVEGAPWRGDERQRGSRCSVEGGTGATGRWGATTAILNLFFWFL